MTHIPLCTKGVLAPAYQWGIVGAGKDYSGLEWMILVQLRDVSESSRVTSRIAAEESQDSLMVRRLMEIVPDQTQLGPPLSVDFCDGNATGRKRKEDIYLSIYMLYI